jgi:hypothetical protein
LWILEQTVAGYPAQSNLLDEIVSGPLILASDLPPVTDHLRKPPKSASETDQLTLDYDES